MKRAKETIHSCENIYRKNFSKAMVPAPKGAGERRDMGTVKVYEYMICKGKIIKLEHRAEEKGNAYWLKSGMTKSFKILRKNELGQVISNHVFSLDDNLKEYRQRIIACLEERVNETKSRLEKQEKMLAEVRNEV